MADSAPLLRFSEGGTGCQQREQTHALPVVPRDLDQSAAPAAEYEQMPLCGLRFTKRVLRRDVA